MGCVSCVQTRICQPCLAVGPVPSRQQTVAGGLEGLERQLQREAVCPAVICVHCQAPSPPLRPLFFEYVVLGPERMPVDGFGGEKEVSSGSPSPGEEAFVGGWGHSEVLPEHWLRCRDPGRFLPSSLPPPSFPLFLPAPPVHLPRTALSRPSLACLRPAGVNHFSSWPQNHTLREWKIQE